MMSMAGDTAGSRHVGSSSSSNSSRSPMEQSRLQRHPSPMLHPVSNLRTSSSSRLQSKKQSLQRMQKAARNRQKCRSRAPRFVSLDQWLGLSGALPQTNLPNVRSPGCHSCNPRPCWRAALPDVVWMQPQGGAASWEGETGGGTGGKQGPGSWGWEGQVELRSSVINVTCTAASQWELINICRSHSQIKTHLQLLPVESDCTYHIFAADDCTKRYCSTIPSLCTRGFRCSK